MFIIIYISIGIITLFNLRTIFKTIIQDIYVCRLYMYVTGFVKILLNAYYFKPRLMLVKSTLSKLRL